jgi:hypothetical protein
MKVRDITVTRSRTLNLGNFESARLEFTATADLEDGETFEEAMALLDKKVRITMRDRVRAIEMKLVQREKEENGDPEGVEGSSE